MAAEENLRAVARGGGQAVAVTGGEDGDAGFAREGVGAPIADAGAGGQVFHQTDAGVEGEDGVGRERASSESG